MENAIGFCLDLNTVKKMEQVSPWIEEDLPYTETSEEFKTDLKNYNEDKLGFPTSLKIKELKFEFSKNAILKNIKKLKENKNGYEVLRVGIGTNQIQFHIQAKRRKSKS